jgi:hypothetical protein
MTVMGMADSNRLDSVNLTVPLRWNHAVAKGVCVPDEFYSNHLLSQRLFDAARAEKRPHSASFWRLAFQLLDMFR